MTKIVLLNGPPGSGKDEAARALCRDELQIAHKKFAGKLKRDLVCILDLPKTWNQMEVSADRWKDTPNTQHCYGYTPRELAIWYSEDCIKPKLGKDFFGKVLSREIKGSPARMVVISDSGFATEAAVLVKDFGKDNVLLIHLQRDGCTFEGDSRSYIELDGVTTIEINNRHDKDMYRIQIINAVYKWAGWELPEDCQ